MKKYIVYLDYGRSCIKEYIPAKNEKDARKYVEGNGEVVAIKDVSEDFPISYKKVVYALRDANFGSAEIAYIMRTLEMTKIVGEL